MSLILKKLGKRLSLTLFYSCLLVESNYATNDQNEYINDFDNELAESFFTDDKMAGKNKSNINFLKKSKGKRKHLKKPHSLDDYKQELERMKQTGSGCDYFLEESKIKKIKKYGIDGYFFIATKRAETLVGNFKTNKFYKYCGKYNEVDCVVSKEKHIEWNYKNFGKKHIKNKTKISHKFKMAGVNVKVVNGTGVLSYAIKELMEKFPKITHIIISTGRDEILGCSDEAIQYLDELKENGRIEGYSVLNSKKVPRKYNVLLLAGNFPVALHHSTC